MSERRTAVSVALLGFAAVGFIIIARLLSSVIHR